jgi:hypothetical protein
LPEGPVTRLGPYKLLQQIGEGGMGVVWMAEQEQPVRRRVALKIIKPGMDSRQVIARFEAVWRKRLAAERRWPGGVDPEQIEGTLVKLGQTLLRQKKYTDAEPFLRECLALREQHRPDSWLRFNAQSVLGATLTGQQKFAEAEPLLQTGYEGIKQRVDKIPKDLRRVRLTEAVDRLVELYRAWDKPEAAAKWRQELEAIQQPAPGRDSPAAASPR